MVNGTPQPPTISATAVDNPINLVFYNNANSTKVGHALATAGLNDSSDGSRDYENMTQASSCSPATPLATAWPYTNGVKSNPCKAGVTPTATPWLQDYHVRYYPFTINGGYDESLGYFVVAEAHEDWNDFQSSGDLCLSAYNQKMYGWQEDAEWHMDAELTPVYQVNRSDYTLSNQIDVGNECASGSGTPCPTPSPDVPPPLCAAPTPTRPPPGTPIATPDLGFWSGNHCMSSDGNASTVDMP